MCMSKIELCMRNKCEIVFGLRGFREKDKFESAVRDKKPTFMFHPNPPPYSINTDWSLALHQLGCQIIIG